MKICENCGLELDKDSTYCKSCGKLIDKGILSTQISIPDIDLENSIPPKNINNEQTSFEMKGVETKTSLNKTIFPRLCIEKGGTEGREFPITKEINSIGRWDPNLNSHPEVDLSDEDIHAKVSRIHARIIKNEEGYYIEDVGSKNGTFLNREYRLVNNNMYKIKDNDEIIIGHIFFKFKLT